MNHLASREFWKCYNSLADDVQKLANKSFELLKGDPTHPSLHLKKVGRFRSVRVGLQYRAMAVEVEYGLLWFWIGNHSEYELIIGG